MFFIVVLLSYVMCTCLLVFCFYHISGLTAPHSPCCRVERAFRWFLISRHSVHSHGSECPYLWTVVLLMTWHKICLNSALSVTGNTLTAFHLESRRGEFNGHTMVLNYQELLGSVVIIFEAMTPIFFNVLISLKHCFCYAFDAPLWICRGATGPSTCNSCL